MPLKCRLAVWALRYCYISALADSVAKMSTADITGSEYQHHILPIKAAYPIASAQFCSGVNLLLMRSRGEGAWHRDREREKLYIICSHLALI